MRKTIELFTLLSVLTTFPTSCTDKVYSEANVIRIDKTEKTMPDSVFLDGMKAVKLDTRDDCALYGIGKISEYDGIYYVKDVRQDKIFLFGNDGQLKKIVDRKGRGHGEYVNLIDFTIDRYSRELLVLAYPQKMLHFTLDGTYKSETSLDSYFKEIACDRDAYYLRYETYANNQPKSYSVRCIRKKTGEGKDLIPMDHEHAPFCSLGPSLFDNGKELFYVRFFDANVYQLVGGEDKPKYQLDYGDYKFAEDLLEDKFDCAKLSSLAWKKKMIYAMTKLKEGNRYLLFSSNLFAYNLYDRQTRQCVHFSSVGSDQLNIEGATYLPIDGTENKICMIVEPSFVSGMEAVLKSEKDMKETVRKRMEKTVSLFQKQSDNDNPLLLVFSLK